MMNRIWAILLLSSFLYSCFCGRLEQVSETFTQGAGEAVEFALQLAGITAVWSGLMEIAEQTGLIKKLSTLLLPVTAVLFPGLKDREVLSSIVLSFMANLLGTGSSSTVFALRTMEKLDSINYHSSAASNEMCTFAAVNMALAPLIPAAVLQIRMDMGSADPFSVIYPSILTGGFAVSTSILSCKILERRF